MRFAYSYRKMDKLFANSGDPDQTSDLGLHCLPITVLRVSRLQWVKNDPKLLRVQTKIFG